MRAGGPRLMLKHSTVLLLSILCLAVCLWPTRGAAQEVTATINGTVTDPAGNVVANADVTATDLDRGTVWPAKTNHEGYFNLTRLPVGRYEVRVTAPGFRVALETTPDLQLNQTAVVNVQLVVGSNNETVQVTSEAPLLQTESTAVGTVIDEKANVDLPLASRNYLQLTLLTPGVVSPNPIGANGSFDSGATTGQNARPEINGNRFTAVDYIIDGMDNNEMASNFIAYTPQPDAIQEFNLITQNAPADFGNYMGGVISVSTKSGTNKFHGSVFEFFRNNVLNANEWWRNLDGDPRQPLRWNQFGGAIGGPVVKNKLFFFADYEATRFDYPTSASSFSVLTAKERTGDFSELLGLPTPVIIRNPITQTPYPGNIITSGLSPAALALAGSQYYPTPINTNLTANAIDFSRTYTNVDQGDGRVDWVVNDKNHVFGRFSKENLVNPTTNSYLLAYNPDNPARVWNTVIDYTRAISNTLVNDARFGISYVNVISNQTDSNSVDVSQFGISGLTSSILPAMTFSKNYLAGGVGGSHAAFGSKDSYTVQADTVIQYQDVLNWIHGKHNSRFGFQGWRIRMNGFFPGNGGLAGNFDFNGQYSGSAESDFMLGLPDIIQVGRPGPVWGQRGNIFSGFYQDDWKLTQKLTLNLGLRYENHTPWYEAKNKQVNFDPITGNLELPGQGGFNRAMYNDYNGVSNFQPRIGISYLLLPKTVLRLGYAMSEFMEGTGLGLRLPENPPFSVQTQANYGSLTYPTTTLDQGFTPISTTNPCTIQGLETADPACYSGNLLLAWDRHVQPARSSQWNLTVQQQITNAMTFQVGYVGQAARHLAVPKQLAQVYIAPDGTIGPSLFFNENQNLIGLGAIPFATYSEANSNYNALQAEIQGRASHGLSYELSYTWSHCLTNATGYFGEGSQSGSQDAWFQDVYNPKADYGSCYFNVKNVFSGYVIYELPFGRGRTYGNNINSVANAVVGNWRVSVVPTFRGGFPITIGANNPPGTNSYGERADCNGPPIVYGKSQPLPTSLGGGYQWFSQAPYSQPAAGYGTCSISSVYGPGERDVDVGLAKSFIVHEQQNVEFRTEFVNTFNHTILDAPQDGLGSSLGFINGANSSQGARNIQFALKYNF